MSAMELDGYSKTILQAFFMLNLATYYFLKIVVTNETADWQWRYSHLYKDI